MKHGSFALLASVALLCCGCQSNRELRSHIDLLERDLRWQEDEIYYLQDQMSDQEQRLDSARRENAGLKRDLQRTDGRSFNPRNSTPPGSSVPNDTRPKDTKPKDNGGKMPPGMETPDLTLPKIDLGPESKDPPKSPFESGASNGGSYGNGLGTPGLLSASLLRNSAKDEYPTDDVVLQIVLNKRLTGGHNSDGHPGDDGIMVMFEPQNAAGQFVPLAGDVSIALVDPTLDGEAGRFARWEFASDEVVTHLQKTLLAKGYQFEQRWPNGPPKNPQMKIYVRYLSREGQRLIAEKDVRLRLSTDPNNSPSSPPPLTAQRPDRLTPNSLNNQGDTSSAPAWKPFR